MGPRWVVASLGALGSDYIGSVFSDLINLGVTISAFAATLAAATGASRMLFELAREEGIAVAGSDD